MEHQLHASGAKAGRPHVHKNFRWRAGLPAKRFFTRFSAISDVPAEDLEALSESLMRAMDVDPASQVPALRAMVRREIRARGAAGRE
ncbi:hypothetical protein ACFVYC_06115 [Pseudarthrobacter sp. NPDC058329]|uniref:hypothetical protein n=1 Tax=Pseudarthrobacter sp. NPDC058329 TaxID=3346448 RepID=UPI0036DF7F73